MYYKVIRLLVTCRELPYWFKASFSLIFLEIFPHDIQKIILCEMRSNQQKPQEAHKLGRNSKLLFEWWISLVTIFNQLLCCWLFWMTAITKKITKMSYGIKYIMEVILHVTKVKLFAH